jgi:hypothetical protein
VLLQGFFAKSAGVRGVVSAGVGNISADLGGALRLYLACIYIWCIARRYSRASSPRA